MSQILRSDSYRRDGRGFGDGDGRRGIGVWPLLGFMVMAILLLGLERLEHPFAKGVRALGMEATGPFLGVTETVSSPLRGWVVRLGRLSGLAQENEQLVADNQRLKSWQGRALDLEQRLKSLEALSKSVEAPKIDFVTTRVIADAGGPFVRSIIIDAGRDAGVKPGYPVMSADGLVGRVVSVSRHVARVLLLVDFNSRIPVQIGPQAERAVMEGDNSPLMRLAYQSAAASIKPGDRVLTSGVGGFFPRGLTAGRIVDTGDSHRIEPAAILDRLDYVSVLLFDTPTAELDVGDGVAPASSKRARRRAALPGVSSKAGAGGLTE